MSTNAVPQPKGGLLPKNTKKETLQIICRGCQTKPNLTGRRYPPKPKIVQWFEEEKRTMGSQKTRRRKTLKQKPKILQKSKRKKTTTKKRVCTPPPCEGDPASGWWGYPELLHVRRMGHAQDAPGGRRCPGRGEGEGGPEAEGQRRPRDVGACEHEAQQGGPVHVGGRPTPGGRAAGRKDRPAKTQQNPGPAPMSCSTQLFSVSVRVSFGDSC